MEPKEALKEVLRSDDVYELNRGSPLGEWRPDRLKLARRPLVPQPIAGCVSKEAQRFLRDTPGFIVKSESDLAHIAEEGVAIRPYCTRPSGRTVRPSSLSSRSFTAAVFWPGVAALAPTLGPFL